MSLCSTESVGGCNIIGGVNVGRGRTICAKRSKVHARSALIRSWDVMIVCWSAQIFHYSACRASLCSSIVWRWNGHREGAKVASEVIGGVVAEEEDEWEMSESEPFANLCSPLCDIYVVVLEAKMYRDLCWMIILWNRES